MEKQFPDFFKRIKIEHVTWSIHKGFIQFVFIVCQVKGSQNILKLSCRSLAFTSYKSFFEKPKEVLLYYVDWPNFITWLLLLWEILDNMHLSYAKKKIEVWFLSLVSREFHGVEPITFLSTNWQKMLKKYELLNMFFHRCSYKKSCFSELVYNSSVLVLQGCSQRSCFRFSTCF